MSVLTGYRPHQPRPASTRGWDDWAADYAALPGDNPVYRLAKASTYRLLDALSPAGGWRRVLDFNCGCGNDLDHLLARADRVVGCDGSVGMLNVAAERFASEAERLALFEGRAEDLDAGAFGGAKFDLVYSSTGGLAYLDDASLQRVHRVLAQMLAPGGMLVTGHFTRGCLAEIVYHTLHLRPRAAVRRLKGRLPLDIRGERLTMYLRSPERLRRLLETDCTIEALAPVMVATPPFQTGYRPKPLLLRVHASLERRLRSPRLGAIADQVFVVARPRNTSS